ncbi:INO80 complex subunit B isoform X2 [Seriola lalandi dorsalis]|uniref:INO80 complex subunit B isoform X2 n=1 Tax=Seriola lalandi dorsalis TaxID=1841481 RepID=UPI000C6FCAE5|nr:INO80 complex subunit B isoform X2 [Seriola lalandi dorsalis]XP_056225189.1 INO80 complex subunit B isoform X2 [Seriola aureovittata]
MGKRKDMIHPRFLGEGSSSLHSVHKRKHKKHKKHKRKHHSFTEAPEPEPVVVPRPPPQLRLKIKLGGQTLGTKSVPTFTVHPGVARPPSPLMIIDNVDVDDDDEDDDDDDDDDEPSVPLEQYRAWLDMDSDSMLGGPVDEEERWLDALEKGELDDNGELKKEVDESLLTARQKALLHKQQSQPLLELPMGYKEKEMTAEMMQKREERARKRRLQAAKKAEENKNQTIERLTKTSKAKIKSMKEKKSKQNQCPMIRYSDSVQGMAISFPTGVPAPDPVPPCPLPPTRVSCGVSGCDNLKKYSCSKTGVPLCSLECYKRNLLLVQGAA